MDRDASKCRLGDITAVALAGVLASNPVILLPLGSQEDHGPCLPMGDYLMAETLAVRIAEAAAARGVPAYVAPGLPFGVADYFGASAGGMALAAGTFQAMLAELLESLLRHGLTRLVILNGHGGNVPVIHDVTLRVRRARNLVIPSFYLWKIASRLMQARLGPEQAGRFGHGAEPLLSLSLALRPADTVLGAPPLGGGTLLGLPVGGFGTLDFNGLPIDVPAEFGETPMEAIRAALPLASSALGQAVADDLVAAGADFVVHFASAASDSGVSKSRSTALVSAGTSTTNSM